MAFSDSTSPGTSRITGRQRPAPAAGRPRGLVGGGTGDAGRWRSGCIATRQLLLGMLQRSLALLAGAGRAPQPCRQRQQHGDDAQHAQQQTGAHAQ
ncbi:hypothetical protein G6F52_013937 [Rhizopus delemar]|nr:hypothetical protein G6F52_013937 [Rhizopus delemar]